MTLKYACTALVGTNKTGMLKPDKNGYYRVVLGALNFPNNNKIIYDYESSKHVFESSNTFMRRMTAGNLYGEYEHPDWVDGWTLEQFMSRVRFIDGTNVSHHIRDIEIVKGPMENGRQVYIIYGSVKPDRIHGKLLQAAFDNPDQNVCFSIRSIITDRIWMGQRLRTVDELITFDWVTEPGIKLACKWNAPGLESYGVEFLGQEDGKDVAIPYDVIENLYQKGKAAGHHIGMESDQFAGLEALRERLAQKGHGIGKPIGLIAW